MPETRDAELLWEIAYFRREGYEPYLVAFYNGHGEFRLTTKIEHKQTVVTFLTDLIEKIDDAYVSHPDTPH